MRFLKVHSLFQQDAVENAIYMTDLRFDKLKISRYEHLKWYYYFNFPSNYSQRVEYCVKSIEKRSRVCDSSISCFTILYDVVCVLHIMWGIGYLFVWMSVGLIFYSRDLCYPFCIYRQVTIQFVCVLYHFTSWGDSTIKEIHMILSIQIICGIHRTSSSLILLCCMGIANFSFLIACLPDPSKFSSQII